jgi:hypothetical protein
MTVPLSFSGKAQATYLATAITDLNATSFTVASASTWTETVPVGGPNYGQPLGTSGPFVLTLDYGLSTEEKVLCTAVNTSTGLVTGVTRAYDGTTAQTHAAAAANPVIHTYSADTPYQANLGVTNAATAQSTANAALPKAGGTMTGAIAMGSNKITGLAAGTTTGDAINYTQLSTLQTEVDRFSFYDGGVQTVGVATTGTNVWTYSPTTNAKYLVTAMLFIDNATGATIPDQGVSYLFGNGSGAQGGSNTTPTTLTVKSGNYWAATVQSVFTGTVGSATAMSFRISKTVSASNCVFKLQVTVQGIQ